MLHIPNCNESKKYRMAAINAISSPAMVCDSRLKILEVNDSCCELLAYSEEELNGKSFLDLCQLLEASKESCLIHYLSHYAIVEFVMDCNLIAKDRDRVNVRAKIRGIYSPQGKLIKVLIMMLKIYSAKGFSSVLDTAPSTIVVAQREELFETYVKGIGQTLGVNCVMIGQLSKEKHFSKVKMLWENGQVFKQMVFVNTKSPCEEMIEKRRGYFVSQISQSFSENVFLKDRVYNWYAGVPIYDFRGAIIGHISILNDKPLPDPQIVRSVLFSMTPQIGIELERASFEQAIVEIERKYKLVLDHATDAIFVIDGDSNCIINYNQRALALFNLSNESIDPNHTILDFSPPKQADGDSSKQVYEKLFVKALQEGQTQKIHWQFKKPNGLLFNAEINLTPYNQEDDFPHWMLIIQENESFNTESERDQDIPRLEMSKGKTTAREQELQIELDHQNRKLSSNLMLSSQLTKLLYSIKASLQKLGPDVSDNAKAQINQILKKVDRSIDLEEDWRKFKLHFEKVHPTFFTKLLDRYPSLNPVQLRHCAYIQLGLSSKETAQLLNVAPKSIEMARYRLKKKMNLEKNIRLSEFIQSL